MKKTQFWIFYSSLGMVLVFALCKFAAVCLPFVIITLIANMDDLLSINKLAIGYDVYVNEIAKTFNRPVGITYRIVSLNILITLVMLVSIVFVWFRKKLALYLLLCMMIINVVQNAYFEFSINSFGNAQIDLFGIGFCFYVLITLTRPSVISLFK